jgi:flagellar hook assembly protein FlgD
VLGYIEFNVASHIPADFTVSNVMLNDVPYGSSRSTLDVSGAGTTGTTGFAVEQNMPNPFVLANSATTAIRFNLTQSQNVTIRVYDMLGKLIRSIVEDRSYPSGESSVTWDARDNAGVIVPTGAYYYQVNAGDNTQTVKMEVAR